MSTRLINVAGEWRQGTGDNYATIYPADGSVTAELVEASVDDVNEAVERGDRVVRDSNWATRKPHERAAVLYRVSQLIRDNAEELAQEQRRDNGKPIGETRALVASAAGTFQFFAAACETLEETLTPARGDYLTMSVHDPLGVVAAITPWNSPIASEAQKMAPALAAGNAVVVKPARATPLMALALGRLCEAAGVPPGIISILPGSGSVIGEAIIRHPLVKRVSFTGGTKTGRHIAHVGADKLMPVSLELGGKSPTIVFDDADIEHAIAGVLFGIFSSSGESCIAGSRLFVEQGIYPDFMDRLVAATERLRVGDPEDETTQMGPLISMAHRENVEGYVQLGLEEDGELLTGGKRPQGALFDKGSFYTPTIFRGLDNATRTSQEEIFGPVLVAMPFADEAELIEQANASVYGLASGLWTRDYKKAWRVGRALDTGTVWINTYKKLSISTPFGGTKDAGIGREKGRLGILEYTRQKSLYWGLNDEPLPWAGTLEDKS